MPINPSLRKITSAEFAARPVAEQLDMLRCLDARQKIRLLLDAPNGAELMANLPAQEVYLLVMERGPEQLPELLSLATPEQWEAFFDLDCWSGDEFNATQARKWLATLLENGEGEVYAVLKDMNFEQLILMFKHEVEVLSGPETIHDDDKRVEAAHRDGGYELKYRDENGAKLFGRVLDILHHYEAEFFFYLLEAVRAETMGLIEESVYQQRVGRLLDMGIPDPSSAGKVYAWLDPEAYRQSPPQKLLPGVPRECAPGFTLTLSRPKGLLAEVLAFGLDEQLAWELANLVNKVLVADRVSMGDLEAVAAVIARVDACLNLALEWLAGNDAVAARGYLENARCEDLFRLGHSLTVKLQGRARDLRKSTIAPYLEEPFRDFLAALDRKVPQYYLGLDNFDHTGTRLFEQLLDIERVSAWLDLVEVQRRLFEDHLGFVLPDPESGVFGEEPTLADIFLTALANRLLGRTFAPIPLAEEELPGLHGMVAQGGGVNPVLRAETVKWLETLVPGGGRFAEYCMDCWQDEFCAVRFDEVDPRYVGGLIMRPQEEAARPEEED